MSQQCECYAKVYESDPRYEIWVKIDPEGKIPLKHPLPQGNTNFPSKMFYVGDAKRLTDAQKETMVQLLSKKFGIPKEEIANDLYGVTGEFHVLADNVIVGICGLHVRCML